MKSQTDFEMKKIFVLIMLLLSFLTSCVSSQKTSKTAGQIRWPAEKAWKWYDKQPWLVGCNFIPSTAINQLEMWQADTFDAETIDKELGYANQIGFNTVRVYLHDLVWQLDSKGFTKRIDKFLDIADKHNIKVMFVLLDSCWNPHPEAGKQPEPKPHTHNSGWVQSPHIDLLKDINRHNELKGYIQGVVKHFRKDKRVLAWDIYNEPGNRNWISYGQYEPENKTELQIKLLKKAFEWARKVNPTQPLTCGLWAWEVRKGEDKPAINEFMLQNSDIITFHNYGPSDGVKNEVLELEKYGRPLLCTEYMNRGTNNTVITLLPIFKEHKVGAYNWGLVAGKTQTIYPWDSWEKTYTKQPETWFHDLLRPDGEPFNKAEIELIKEITSRK